MEYELIARFSDKDIARIAMDRIKQDSKFSYTELVSNNNSNRAYFGTQIPLNFISSVYEPSVFSNSGQTIENAVRFIGEKTDCEKATKILENMGAKEIKLNYI